VEQQYIATAVSQINVMDAVLCIMGSGKDLLTQVNGMMMTDMIVLDHNKTFYKKCLTLHNKMIIL
jgi:predicted O-methyltransferase YrrM